MSREDVVTAARAWLGTPYKHQASVRGCGTDCLGLLLGVWRQVLGGVPEAIPGYSADWAEPQGDEVLWTACARHMVQQPLDSEALGDVLLFRMRDGALAKHLGIQSRVGESARFVHAYSGHGVVETSLSSPWHRRIVARFAFPLAEERGV